MKKSLKLVPLLLASLMLSACGGGNEGSSSGASGSGAPSGTTSTIKEPKWFI